MSYGGNGPFKKKCSHSITRNARQPSSTLLAAVDVRESRFLVVSFHHNLYHCRLAYGMSHRSSCVRKKVPFDVYVFVKERAINLPGAGRISITSLGILKNHTYFRIHTKVEILVPVAAIWRKFHIRIVVPKLFASDTKLKFGNPYCPVFV